MEFLIERQLNVHNLRRCWSIFGFKKSLYQNTDGYYYSAWWFFSIWRRSRISL